MSGAAQSSWKPPDADRQWAPPASDRPGQPQDAGFFATIGKALKDAPSNFMDFVSGHPLDSLKQAGADLTEGRKKAFQQAKDAYHSGNYKEAFEHLAGSIPIIGPPVNDAMNEARQPEPGAQPDETHQGLPGQGLAHGALALAPYAGPLVEAAPAIAAGARGAVSGGIDAATETIPLTRYGVPVNVPKPLATGAAAGAAARMAGLPATPAAVIGAAAPIVRGAVSGAKAALAERLGIATEAAAVPAAAAETAGQALARSNGMDWAKLSADDRMLMEHAAKAQQNAKAAPPPPMAPQPAPPAPAAAQPAAAQNVTIQDLLQQEMAARQAPPAPAAAPAPGPMIGAHDTTPIPAGKAPPLRPPLQAPQSTPPASPAPTAAPVAMEPPAAAAASGAPAPAPPVKPSMAQAEAWMMRKGAPEIEDPGRYMHNPDGSLKSPALRGAEVKAYNVAAKSERFAQALFEAGVEPAEILHINPGRVSMEQISNGATPGWGNVTDDLVSKGFLEKGELPPNESIPAVVRQLKKLKSAKIAADLKAEMEASGTLAK